LEQLLSIDSVSPDQTIWVIIQNNELILNKDGALPTGQDITSLVAFFIRYFRLGLFNGKEYFCAEINADCIIVSEFTTVPLRKALTLFHPDQYGIGVKAYSVINWDKNHQYCGCCGGPTVHQGNSFERICPSCQVSFFPRISPSIIVLVHKEDHLVMARSPHFPPGVYGLIAGFVEAGESLEEAACREVQEEVGLQIKNLSYFGSQPWPFPDSLMVAFTAEYDSGEIVIDENEIESASWYRYNNLPGRPSTSISIAAILLDSFVGLCNEKYQH
jgi:NAD+ diphosphatase